MLFLFCRHSVGSLDIACSTVSDRSVSNCHLYQLPRLSSSHNCRYVLIDLHLRPCADPDSFVRVATFGNSGNVCLVDEGRGDPNTTISWQMAFR